MKTDNRRLIVKFTIAAPLVGSFVSDYGDKVEGLEISPIVNIPYHKNKPEVKPRKKPKPKRRTKSKQGLTALLMRSLSRTKTATMVELRGLAKAKGFSPDGISGTLNNLKRRGKVKSSGGTIIYTNGVDHG